MGQIDHLSNQRILNVVANISGEDYGRAAAEITRVIAALGGPARGVTVENRSQLAQMIAALHGLRSGLVLAIVVVVPGARGKF